jgi:serine/threonine protein kinase/formylglycine-generating enzyme required for sulfatase activity
MICPSCQAVNDDNQETCFQCGKGLRALVQGSVLASRYEILSPIGKGGMGMVYKAQDRMLHNEIVAVKVMRAEAMRDPETAKRFRSEILLARKVRHKNVCGIYEYNVDGDIEFIAMELIEGKDYRQILRAQGPLPLAEAFRVSLQIAEGLEAVHEAGVIHRDLKTANVMRDIKGVARLMDFGIAKSLGGEGGGTATGTVVGTPEYMSPEQVRAEKVDARSDLYALGIMIWELFTGHLPFKGDTPVATLFKHIQDPPPFDAEAGRKLPPVIVPLLRRVLSKDPDQRYASAREMIDALREAEKEMRANLPPSEPTLGPSTTLVGAASQAATGPLASPAPAESPTVVGPSTLVEASPEEQKTIVGEAPRPPVAPPVPPPAPVPPPIAKPPAPPVSAPVTPVKPAPSGPPVALLVGGAAIVVVAALLGWHFLTLKPRSGPWTNPKDGLLYMVIAAGKAEIGCVPDDTQCEANEKPRHPVEISRPFRLGRTEVTVAAFKQFVEKTGHKVAAGGNEGMLDSSDRTTWDTPGFHQDGTHPVTHVSWSDAVAYCKWADGRLPTEAEWEYAARGGDAGTVFVWGNKPEPSVAGVKQANVRDESVRSTLAESAQIFDNYDDEFVKTAPVGSFAPNAFGLYDMAGNVWEWCADWIAPYAEGPARDPRGPDTGTERVRRGGSWKDVAKPLRLSNRVGESPALGADNLGFRCALDGAP